MRLMADEQCVVAAFLSVGRVAKISATRRGAKPRRTCDLEALLNCGDQQCCTSLAGDCHGKLLLQWLDGVFWYRNALIRFDLNHL
jgi:hypothetical protein